MVDDKYLHGAFFRNKFEAELLLNGGKQVRTAIVVLGRN